MTMVTESVEVLKPDVVPASRDATTTSPAREQEWWNQLYSGLIGVSAKFSSLMSHAAQLSHEAWQKLTAKLADFAGKARVALENIARHLRADSFSLGASFSGISVSITFKILVQ